MLQQCGYFVTIKCKHASRKDEIFHNNVLPNVLAKTYPPSIISTTEITKP